MAVLNTDESTQKFILPSTADQTGDDQAWVEMTTYPKVASDYDGTTPSQMVDNTFMVRHILAKRIKSWNMTDQGGVALPIEDRTVGFLDVDDVYFLFGKIQKVEGAQTLSTPEKKT